MGVNVDTGSLQQRGIASLNWLTNNLNRFTPWRDEQLTDAGLQAFAELSILYALLEQCQLRPFCKQLSLDEILAIWRQFILDRCEHQPYAELARKRPPQAYWSLLPYFMLRATGYRSSYYEDTLRRLHRWGYPSATEVVPYRLLDQQYFLWKARYLSREPNWYKLYRDTTLPHIRSLVYIDRDAAYSITHTIFYLTDFGNRPAPLNETEITRTRGLIECLLIHYWRLSNWDMVGELLVTLHCLGKRESFFYADAANAFLNAWGTDGAIPGNHAEAAQLRSARGPERDALVFRICYHTTLVGVLYWFTGLEGL